MSFIGESSSNTIITGNKKFSAAVTTFYTSTVGEIDGYELCSFVLLTAMPSTPHLLVREKGVEVDAQC